MKILGISAFYHDAAAALIIDGQVVAAAQEERFSRIKNDASFPLQAIQFCLKEQRLKISDVDGIAYYDKPFLKFERILESYYATAPFGLSSFLKSMPIWIKEKLFIKRTIKGELKKLMNKKESLPPLYFPEHHLSHAASAYYPSTFSSANILTIDGVGEYTTTSISFGDGNAIKQLRSLSFPHSLGLLYAAATYYLGFKINSGEYKVMGLASYGDANSEQFNYFYQQIKKHLIHIKADGSFWMDQQYFNYLSGLRMTRDKKWEKIFGIERRTPDASFEKQHQNLALAFQKVTEEVVLKLIKTSVALTGNKNLCLAGGVALNCVANGEVLKKAGLDHIYVQPAAGDAGGAVGAALALSYLKNPKQERIAVMPSAYLGPLPKIDELEEEDPEIIKLEFDDFQELCEKVADLLSEGKTLGWVQGRMEFGPRALGNRSILADPRPTKMMHHINTLIKNRETFRPFAPVVLQADAQDYFEMGKMKSAPYMLFTFPVKSRDIPAVTHVDQSARVQTVSDHFKDNANAPTPRIYSLLQAFKAKTGCPLLLNTSFNVKDEPMVCSANDAYCCFLNTNLDHLVIENTLYSKREKN